MNGDVLVISKTKDLTGMVGSALCTEKHLDTCTLCCNVIFNLPCKLDLPGEMRVGITILVVRILRLEPTNFHFLW